MAKTRPQLSNSRITEWIVSILTLGLILVTVLTYILEQNKNNWVCGPVLLIFEFIAIGIQAVLTLIVWYIKNQIIKIIVTFISIGILTYILSYFITFITKCS